MRGCEAADYSREVSACEDQEFGGAALAKISESVSIKVALFSLSMFRYSLHSSTRQNTASIVLFSDPPETTASILLRNP